MAVPVVHVSDYTRAHTAHPAHRVLDYLLRLFPILTWIQSYNLTWATGDLIAGLTVGMVLVPQGMSYAQLASLPVQYGLYSSFVGVLVYPFFATSKDVSIGPVAVMSQQVSYIITDITNKYGSQWSAPHIATTLAFICGFIALAIGLLRLGWIVELIPAPAVCGYMTGSALNIIAGQVPGLMGISGFNTKASTYEVIINTLKGLPRTQLDAAWGLSGLAALYIIRFACVHLSHRYPSQARLFFFISVFRNAFVIIILTLASYLYCHTRRTHSGSYPIKILQTVPSGLRDVGPPNIDPALLSALAPQIPVATIILVLEHISIAKSFGRINNYKIDPNQELIAIGVTNTVGSVFAAYPATGSFSRSALKAKSGVRTPAAGIISAIVVIVALYGLTGAFFWIPTAGLSAVIIHAVADLITTLPQAFAFWRVSPLEALIFLADVIVTVFSSIEDGIYVAVAASFALLLLRIAHPRGKFLGTISVHVPDNPALTKTIYLPLDPAPHSPRSSLHPHLPLAPPPPGTLIYRFEESLLYPNCSLLNSAIVDWVRDNVRRGRDMRGVGVGNRAWNDVGGGITASIRRWARGEAAIGKEARQQREEAEREKPDLWAVVLDFSAISQIDTTAVQALIDTRNELQRWCDHPVEFHFATVLSPWIRRALVAGGFGIALSDRLPSGGPVAVVPYVGGGAPTEDVVDDGRSAPFPDPGAFSASPSSIDVHNSTTTHIPLLSPDTPFFHLDLDTAVRAAEKAVERCEGERVVVVEEGEEGRESEEGFKKV